MLHRNLPFKRLAIWIFLGLVLSGCVESGAQAQAVSTLAVKTQPALISPSRPAPPTPTAVVFQLKATSAPPPTRTPFVATLTYAYGPEEFPLDVNPLTGMIAADPTLLNRRTMAVKVTNFPRSVRPQWGLSTADHVYIYYIGDQMTRFIAVYYGADSERVGPVRSARYFDEHIVRMYKSVFVFGSADERVLNPWLESDLRNFLVIERPSNCPPLCRIGPEGNYNTLFVNTQQLTQYITDRGTNNDRQDLTGLRFDWTVPFSGQPGNRLSVYFTYIAYNRWEFDSLSGRYLYFQEAEDERQSERSYLALTDSASGAQIAADNVVVLHVPHEYMVNTATTEMVNMNFTGQGNAYAFREGQMFSVRWQRAAQGDLISLVYPDGRPFPLKPGNTWFEVIGESSPVEQQPDGEWSFKFQIP